MRNINNDLINNLEQTKELKNLITLLGNLEELVATQLLHVEKYPDEEEYFLKQINNLYFPLRNRYLSIISDTCKTMIGGTLDLSKN